MLRNVLYSILFFIACTPSNNIDPPCYTDEGIMEAVTIAVSYTNEDESLSQLIKYDEYGKPILRRQDGKREIVYKYDDDKLISTTVSNYSDLDSELEDKELFQSKETNKVTKNDQFGRALVIIGADGGRVEYTYAGCNMEIQKYYDYAGGEIHEYRLYYEKGVLIKAIWFTPSDSKGQEIKYFNYKFDSRGKWIEREYELASGETVLEKRTIKYY